MSRLRCLAVLLWAIATPALADPAGVSAPKPEAPFVAVRILQSLQDQVAQGDRAAQAAQPKLMAHIADEFLAADPSLWKEPRNTRAAILFLLSGGRPAVIRNVLTHAAMASDLDRLLKGALAYGEGQDDVARALLEPIDPRGLPGSLGGQVALIQASLLGERSPAKAAHALDLARLLMPGTLVEEAALRRQIFLSTTADVPERFAFLSSQYLRRYRTSVYFGNFKQRFTAVAVHLAEAGDTARLAKLDPAMAELPVKERRHLFLAMARAALTNGKTEAARFAAARATDPSNDPTDYARAKLYEAAALVATDHVSDGLTMLNALDQAGLSADDASLREAAMAVGETVRAAAPAQPAESPKTVAPSAAAVDAADLIAKAQNAVATSDKLLEATGP